MPIALVFQLQLVLGYVAWILVYRAFILPRTRTMQATDLLRGIAVLHSFRFFGLVFLVPGVVDPALPSSFAAPAAYGDFAAGLLAMLALATFRVRPLFRAFTIAFNLVGIVDLLGNYLHATQIQLAEHAGLLGGTYAIPILYVPVLMLTHLAAFYLLLRPRRAAAHAV